MNPLKTKRDTLIAAMRKTADTADAENRGFTDDETGDLEAKGAEVEALNAQIKRREKVGRDFQSLFDAPATGHTSGGTKHFNPKAIPVVARKVAELGTKRQILGLTGVPESTQLFDGAPISQYGEVGTLAQLLPLVEVESPNFEWFVETEGYTNKADVWTPESGLTKPESTTSFYRKRAELAIVALMSAPLQTYDLQDAPALVEALSNRLMHDFSTRMDRIILEGSEPHGMTGLRNTSGVLSQTLVSDRLLTVRHAVSALELQGLAPTAVVLSVQDWREIETAKTADGEFVFASGPVDRAEKRIWGVPVVVTTQVAQGEGYVLDATAASVHKVLGEPVYVEASSNHSDDFARNQMRIRFEARYGVSVTRPSAVVKLDFTTPAA